MICKQATALASFLLLATTLILSTSCGGSAAEDATPSDWEPPRDTAVVKALEAGVPESVAEEGVGWFVLKGCNKCHKTKGTIKTLGPVLAGIKDRMDIPTMAAWIRYPGRLKRGTLMPPWDGTDEQLIALIAYLRTL